MKTLFGICRTNKLIFTTSFVLLSFFSFAQSANLSPEEKADDNSVGFTIIATILGIGIFGYIVVTLIERYNKKHRKKMDPSVRLRFNRRYLRRNRIKTV